MSEALELEPFVVPLDIADAWGADEDDPDPDGDDFAEEMRRRHPSHRYRILSRSEAA